MLSVPSRISFLEPNVKCAQSSGTLSIPVQRFDDVSGIANVSWQSRCAPNKPASVYDGTNGNLVFADGEREKGRPKLMPHLTTDQSNILCSHKKSKKISCV